jgi:hypothetical protein
LVLTAGCGGSDNNPFGSSGGSGGGGGGGTAGTTAISVLSNNTPGAYGTVPLTLSTGPAGAPDNLLGDAASTAIDLSANSNSMSVAFCPAAGLLACGEQSLWPSFASMYSWTLKFDIKVNMALANVNTIAVSWGPTQCAQVYNVPSADWSNTTFVAISLNPTNFNHSGCTSSSNPVGDVFTVTVWRTSIPLPGDSVLIDNVRWVH